MLWIFKNFRNVNRLRDKRLNYNDRQFSFTLLMFYCSKDQVKLNIIDQLSFFYYTFLSISSRSVNDENYRYNLIIPPHFWNNVIATHLHAFYTLIHNA